MRRRKVYRIYTEEKNKKGIVDQVARDIESFTLQPTLGYYRQRAEKSIVIEIVGAKRRDIDRLAKRIRTMNGQKSVLVLEVSAAVGIDRQ
jgi:hypothetical protein